MGTHSDGSHTARPFEISSEKSKRCTVPVREVDGPHTHFDSINKSQRHSKRHSNISSNVFYYYVTFIMSF